MNEDIKSRASVNAVGNGALGGSCGNAGQGTGMLASHGADLGMDATNSMGSICGDTMSCSPSEEHEESSDFTARKSGGGSQFNGSMGSAKLGD